MTHVPDDIQGRKLDHLRLCAEEDVEYRVKTTLLEDVELLHDSLPELAADTIDLRTSAFGKVLNAPLVITGMTGGAPDAAKINRELAEVAQHLGLAFGVGSQRAILKNKDLASTYQVRDVAPDILLFGNIGGVQAASASTQQIEDLVGGIGADAMCVHLNPGQELLQPEGDRDFVGVVDGLARLASELSVPVIAKETGCGLSPAALAKIQRSGVEWVDTSGAGGTTWIGVETLRSPESQRDLGQLFWDWGIPTAASVVFAKDLNFKIIASGGIRTGLDAARALALGADLVGSALPWLRAVMQGGTAEGIAFGEHMLTTLRVACLLSGTNSSRELQNAPKIIGPRLERWLQAQLTQR